MTPIRFPLPLHGATIVEHGITYTAQVEGMRYLSEANLYCIWDGGPKGGQFYQNARHGYAMVDSGHSHGNDRSLAAGQAIERQRRRYEDARAQVEAYEAA